ncbi:MAG TPA: hypothetical protein VK879_19770 [Candidatus Sulfomarinibacteraceae bacterium]|nr:hypothetical protein [Candidatus Sulfomarinibacteraceae bacterium]
MRTVSITLTAVLALTMLLLVQCAPAESQKHPDSENRPAAPAATLAAVEAQVQELRETVARLSYNTASGGGVNLKMMPHPETGEPTVPMHEVFSFDRNHAICRVDTNPEPFKMQTHEMGEVVIEAHQFYMSMIATSIEQYEVTTDADGTRRVNMRGGLDCATEVGQAETTIGSRTAAEHATYLIEAGDGGIGGGEVGDTFAFTVFFDPDEAPVNYAIFGPEFTFTGEMIEGEISIDVP